MVKRRAVEGERPRQHQEKKEECTGAEGGVPADFMFHLIPVLLRDISHSKHGMILFQTAEFASGAYRWSIPAPVPVCVFETLEWGGVSSKDLVRLTGAAGSVGALMIDGSSAECSRSFKKQISLQPQRHHFITRTFSVPVRLCHHRRGTFLNSVTRDFFQLFPKSLAIPRPHLLLRLNPAKSREART